MDNGRFGPIRPQEKPPKRFRVDYNRLITALMIAVIIVLVVVMARDYKKKKEQPNFVSGDFVNTGVNILVPGATTQEPQKEVRPTAEKEGFLPIFYQANIAQKRVAITVDQCGNASDIKKIFEACAQYGARVTFFPTGEELSANPSLWTAAILGGHEIENHTATNARLLTLDEVGKTAEIVGQTERMRSIIGEDYQPHFLRTNNLEDDEDASVHAILTELGYYGMARWALMTPASFSSVEPGQILAYNANDAGVQALKTALRILNENGYEIVTLNELFGYEENMESTENAD